MTGKAPSSKLSEWISVEGGRYSSTACHPLFLLSASCASYSVNSVPLGKGEKTYAHILSVSVVHGLGRNHSSTGVRRRLLVKLQGLLQEGRREPNGGGRRKLHRS